MIVMKKIAKRAMATVLAMVCASTATAFAKANLTFSDISDEKYSWAVSYIEDMAEKGFISGYEEDGKKYFKPDNYVTKLEALSLFARAMGSTSEANAKAVEYASEEYAATLKGFKLKFGQSDIAYLLYRGALKESELVMYLDDNLVNEPMARYEAAIVMTKAMCAETLATSEVVTKVDYDDSYAIPKRGLQYVDYVTKKKLMSGMGDGTFAPMSNVRRSQMAVMLSNVVDEMNLTVEELKITDVDTDTMNIEYYDKHTDESGKMGYTKNTRVYIEGKLTQARNIPENVNAVFTYVDDELVYVDIDSAIPDKVVEGTYEGYSSKDGVVSVNVRTEDGAKSYPFGEGAVVTYEGESATIRSFSEKDPIVIELSENQIKSITGEKKDKTITNATIESIDIVEDGTITISHALDAYDGKKIKVASDVKVNKNADSSSMADVYKGDKVNLTLEYGIITKVEAESSIKNLEGTIKVIEISATPKITVNAKGKDVVYDMPSDAEIQLVNGEGTIYDLRIGDSVIITIESEAVRKIVTKTASGVAYSRSGVVSAINSSYKFIKITYTENDVSFEEIVYCKDDTTKFITSEGKAKTLKDIKEGDVVSVRGTMTNGAFEASLILIEVE